MNEEYVGEHSEWTTVPVYAWMPWHLRIAAFFAIACTIYMVGWLLLRVLLKRRGASPLRSVDVE